MKILRCHTRDWVWASFLALISAPLCAEQAHHQAGVATVRTGQIFGHPWDGAAGSWRGRVFSSYLDSRSSYDSGGARRRLDNNGRFSNLSLNLFGEYALTDRWSASALLPVQRSHLDNDLGHERWGSVGDVNFWARRRFQDWGRLSPSVVAGLKIPGNYRTSRAVGDGQVDLDLQGVATRSLGRGHFLAANTGYRRRFGAVSDEVVLGAQFGLAPGARWLLVAALNGVRGFGAGVQKDFLDGGFSVVRTLAGPWGLLASYNRTLTGKNTVGADVWSLGVSYR